MRIFLIVVTALLVLACIGLQQSTGVSPSRLLDIFLGWPLAQQLAVAVMILAVLAVLIMAVLQSDAIARQSKAIEILQKRIGGLRDNISAADAEQGGADAAVRHLVGTDPVAIIDNVQQRLLQAEAQTVEQAAQNEAVDLQARIDELRKRQQALRTQLGSVSEKRRVIEPMLGEVKERQALIERALAELEKDGSGKALDVRLQETESLLNKGHTRLETLEAIFAKFEQLKDQTRKLQEETAPLRNPETGIRNRIEQAAELLKTLDATLLSLEKDGEEAVSERFERLSKDKRELEQRLAALMDTFKSLETIRQDVGHQFERLNVTLASHLQR
jgi:chromosome segregation ATPase